MSTTAIVVIGVILLAAVAALAVRGQSRRCTQARREEAGNLRDIAARHEALALTGRR